MASITSNVVTRGLRGKLGDSLVFKNMRGKTFVSTPPRIPDKKKESVAQRTTRVNFQQASEWAQLILLDPERKTYYRQRAKALKLPNAYTAALTDFMRRPEVAKSSNGDTMTYTVSKRDFALKQVDVVDELTGMPVANVLIRQRRDKWLVRYTIHSDTAAPQVLIVIDSCEKISRFNVF